MQRFKTWLAQRANQRKVKQDNLANEIAHTLWLERTGGDQEEVSPEEAERLAALQDRQTGEKIAANPLRRMAWGGRQQLKTFTQSKAPIIQFVRFFVWEIPKWNITAIKLFLQSDIVKLLAVPVLGAIIATTTTINERRENEQVKTFDEYLDQINTLTLDHGLLTDEPTPGAVILARGRTVAALRKLDLKRRQELIGFIQASGLHKGEDAVISFEGANLEGIDLREADLRDFNFKEADLSEANLEGAVLSRANFEGARLIRTNLKVTHFDEANLEGALLIWADLEGADLQVANLEGAKLGGANLEETWFCNTRMPDGEINDEGCFTPL